MLSFGNIVFYATFMILNNDRFIYFHRIPEEIELLTCYLFYDLFVWILTKSIKIN